MLRPATPEALDRLSHAARGTERELDIALTCLGILPPLELAPIREVINLAGAQLHGSANGDGHRMIEVVVNGMIAAVLHHDGRVDLHPRHTGVAA